MLDYYTRYQLIKFVHDYRIGIWFVFALVVVLIWYWYVKNIQVDLDSFNSPEEPFQDFVQKGSVVLKDGYYVIKAGRNQRYCTNSDNGIICNADLAGPNETFLLQSLGEDQYAIKSVRTDLWCSMTSTGLRCVSPTIGDWSVFVIRHLDDGKYSIQCNKNKRFCSDSGHGMVCDVPNMYGWEFQEFEFIPVIHENIK